MRTIRRIYLYVVAIISLEVVTWGLISLVRSIFSAGEIGGQASRCTSTNPGRRACFPSTLVADPAWHRGGS